MIKIDEEKYEHYWFARIVINDHHLISVSSDHKWDDNFTPEPSTINWSAIGNVDIETAKEFAIALNLAIDTAKQWDKERLG